jgi:hypothetical protein
MPPKCDAPRGRQRSHSLATDLAVDWRSESGALWVQLGIGTFRMIAGVSSGWRPTALDLTADLEVEQKVAGLSCDMAGQY